MKADLVKAVRAYALVNYESGWDIVVECYSDAEIIAAIGLARTPAGAIRNVGRGVDTRNEYADDIAATAF